MPCSHPYQLGDEPVPGYRLVKFLGRGGFGEVWKATAPGGATVALKVIINLSGAEGRKELRALSIVKRIQHAHLVPVTAVWLKDGDGNMLDDNFASEEERILNSPARNPADSNSETMVIPPGHTEPRSAELVIAMGLGHKSLFDRLQECKRSGLEGVPTAELLDYMEQAARAIDYLNGANHELGRGVVAVQHCDIKPHNILIVGNAVQVCDFGLARVRGDVRATASTGASVAYASPECLEAEGRPSEATDQYSLAVTYYELRTGLLPYRDSSFAKVMQAVLVGDLDLTKLTPAEQRVVRRATSRVPSQRFPSAMAMVKALRKAVEEPEAAPSSRRIWPALVAATLLLAAVGAGVWGYQNDWFKLPAWPVSDPPKQPTAQDHIKRAEQAIAAADCDLAKAELAKARQLEASAVTPVLEGQTIYLCASNDLAAGKYTEAIDGFLAAAKLDASVVDRSELGNAYTLRGIERQQQGEFQDAIDDFSEAMKESPPLSRELLVRRAECRLAINDASGAAEDAEAAIKADPEFADAWFVHGQTKAAKQDNVAAAADFTRAAELSPELLRNPQRAKFAAPVYHAAGAKALEEKNADQALVDLGKAAELDADGSLGFQSNTELATAYALQAEKLRKGGQLDEAIALCDRAIKDHPKFASTAHSERGECFRLQGKAKEAVDDFTAAIRLDGSNDLAYSRRGTVHIDLKNYEEALHDFDEAIRLSHDYGDRLNRGIVLSTLGRFADAETAFGELISANPADPGPYYQRAIVALDLQQYDRALDDLRQAKQYLLPTAAQDGPAGASARSELADTLALLGWVAACRPGSDRKSIDEAVQDANTACRYSDWKRAWHVDVLAAAYASRGDYSNALHWQEKSVALASMGDARLPPLAPARNELAALYRADQRFTLPGKAPERETSSAGSPATGSKLKPEDSPPGKAATNNPASKRPAATPKQVLEEAQKRLQRVRPNPPRSP